MNNKSYFTKAWQAISSTLFNNTLYTYNRNAVNSRPHDNYNITDPTEIKFISSRRTFL